MPQGQGTKIIVEDHDTIAHVRVNVGKAGSFVVRKDGTEIKYATKGDALKESGLSLDPKNKAVAYPAGSRGEEPAKRTRKPKDHTTDVQASAPLATNSETPVQAETPAAA